MECGVEGLAVLGWLSEHGHVSEEWVAIFRPYLCGVTQWIVWLYSLIKEYAKELIALAGLSFGLLKAFWYREAILHLHLEKYIHESDLRLPPSYKQTVELISRPDRRAKLRQPAFALELQKILQKNNWEPALHSERAYEAMNRQLHRVTEGIANRTQSAENALTSLRQQQAAADTIKAALAVGRALQARDSAATEKYDQDALAYFKKVLNVPGHQSDVIAAEGKARQLLRLGDLIPALTALQDLEAMAKGLSDTKDQSLISSRAKRYQAQIRQAQTTLQAQATQPPGTGGSLAAWSLLVTNVPAALSLREPYVSNFRDWDLIEQGEIHYVAAFVANRLDYVIQEPEQLDNSLSCYERVLSGLPKRRVFIHGAARRLQTAAREGRDRVIAAKSSPRVYALAWLFQPVPRSDQPQQPAETVG